MGPQTSTGQAHGLPGFSDAGLLAALEAASPRTSTRSTSASS